jgi:hypothetical protein
MKDQSRDESFEIDLGKVDSTVDDNLSYISSGTDTITITGIDSSNTYTWGNMNSTISPLTTGSITLPTGSLNYNHSPYTINTGSSGQYLTNGSNGTSWSNNTGTSTVNINTSGIDMAPGTDITIDGKSLKSFMNKMEERLAILVPDPAKLEKFQALKNAYEHYKTMESLCFDEPKEED